ncbi:MAG TPA: hypothetical protein VMJ92_04660 [Candidatus Limnocylindrales bacterium]|nr:hypothetical protein [Candidatus Limnocylindrales bacterium]
MTQLRTVLLALALVVALGLATAEPAEAFWLTKSSTDLLNLTWE